MYDFICIGDTMQDVYLQLTDEAAHIHAERKEHTLQLCFTYANKVPVHQKQEAVGGNAANAAIALSRLGLRTAIYTMVGEDHTGAFITKTLKKDDVSTDYVVVDKGTESNYSTILNLHGERTILVYHLHRHYVLPKLDDTRWIYLTSMGQGSESVLPAVLKYVEAHKINLCFQPGTFQLNYGAEKVKSLLKHTKIFFANKEEVLRYAQIPATDNFRTLLDAVHELGPEIVVITDGSKGAYASDGHQALFLDIIKDVPKLESTGAGDSFSSSFAAAIASGHTLSEALRWGQCNSSSVIQFVGPQAGLLQTTQMEKLLHRYADLQPHVLNKDGKPHKS